MRGPRLLPMLAAIAGLAILSALLLPRFLGPYYLHVVDVTLINVIMALGLNLVLGFGGQISLAQAAFFGIGAYGFAILQAAGWPVWAAPAAVVGCAAVGALPTCIATGAAERSRGHLIEGARFEGPTR